MSSKGCGDGEMRVGSGAHVEDPRRYVWRSSWRSSLTHGVGRGGRWGRRMRERGCGEPSNDDDVEQDPLKKKANLGFLFGPMFTWGHVYSTTSDYCWTG